MAFLGLKCFMVPWRGGGEGAGKGLPASFQEQAHSLCSSHAPAPAGIFGWVSRCWGWCGENRLGSLSSFGLNLRSSPGLELNFPCNAGKCQCWDGSWQSNLLTELSLHHRGSPKSPWYPNTAQELCWLPTELWPLESSHRVMGVGKVLWDHQFQPLTFLPGPPLNHVPTQHI